MMGSFPYELVPDGNVWVAHHYTYLMLAALFSTATVFDDYRRREPVAVSGSLAVGVFAFLFMWPVRGYHALGALLALLAPVIAAVAVLRPESPWRRRVQKGGYPATTAVAVLLLSFGGLDDAVSHAFGVPTPLDALFHVVGVWGSALVISISLLLAALAASSWDRLQL
jgi:hypothetical protein